VNRADIVFDDRDRQLFVELLQEVIRRFGWIIQQFVIPKAGASRLRTS
jgi:hypothetical protein